MVSCVEGYTFAAAFERERVNFLPFPPSGVKIEMLRKTRFICLAKKRKCASLSKVHRSESIFFAPYAKWFFLLNRAVRQKPKADELNQKSIEVLRQQGFVLLIRSGVKSTDLLGENVLVYINEAIRLLWKKIGYHEISDLQTFFKKNALKIWSVVLVAVLLQPISLRKRGWSEKENVLWEIESIDVVQELG